MTETASLYIGKTLHRRFEPFDRSFSYDVAMVCVDVDHLEEAAEQAKLFSVNRANAISLSTARFGSLEPARSMRAWAIEQFAAAGVGDQIGSIHLVTFPSVLGFGFAPISLWLARDADGAFRGVIYEVHNTFGEAHAYVFANRGSPGQHEAAKSFHVSPFFDVAGNYRFTLLVKPQKIALTIENFADGKRIHLANLNLRSQAMNDRSIARWLIMMPFSGFGVILGIHWQALFIWLRGVRYRKTPVQKAERTTVADPVDQPDTEATILRRRA